MRKIFKYALMLVMAITGVMAVSSCSKDDDEEEKTEVVELRAKLDGTWTLVKYKGEKINWGEYMEIKGDSMIWNSSSLHRGRHLPQRLWRWMGGLRR